MSDYSRHLSVYLHLARASERRRRPLVKDRMFVLAGIQAAERNYFQLSQYCRSEILQSNPRHLIGRWPSIGAALLDGYFTTFAARLQSRFPLERAESMLVSLGIEFANEHEVYYDELEYAASILGIEPASISDASGT